MASEFQPGIYKTSKYLPGHEASVPPNHLILIRTDGEFGPASVLMPVRNEHNQWSFGMPGIKVPSASFNWADTLTKLPHEGFYRLLEEYNYGEGGKWLKNAILQLGYNKAGEPIVFIAQRKKTLSNNELTFSDKGIKVDLSWVDKMLEPLAWYQERDGE